MDVQGEGPVEEAYSSVPLHPVCDPPVLEVLHWLWRYETL